ncbi:hypothetical protein ACS0TY_018854 [Phlomoides rotata]
MENNNLMDLIVDERIGDQSDTSQGESRELEISNEATVTENSSIENGIIKNAKQRKRSKRKEAIGAKKTEALDTILDVSDEEESEISCKARKAWEVGKKLCLIGKGSDEDMIRQMEYLERKDRSRVKKNSWLNKHGENRVFR